MSVAITFDDLCDHVNLLLSQMEQELCNGLHVIIMQRHQPCLCHQKLILVVIFPIGQLGQHVVEKGTLFTLQLLDIVCHFS